MVEIDPPRRPKRNKHTMEEMIQHELRLLRESLNDILRELQNINEAFIKYLTLMKSILEVCKPEDPHN